MECPLPRAEGVVDSSLAGIYRKFPNILLPAAASVSTAKSTSMPTENGGLTLPED